MQPGAAQVAVDQQNLATNFRDRDAEIGRKVQIGIVLPRLPAGSRERLETSVSRTRSSMGTVSRGVPAHSTSLRPQSLPTPKTLCSLGRRRSPSINRTLRPISAIAMLRLVARF